MATAEQEQITGELIDAEFTIIETNEQYHADTTRLSNSMAGVLAEPNGPQLFDGYYVSKTLALPQQSEAMQLGEMVHCLVLEPPEFANRFAQPIPGLDRVRMAGKAAWKCFDNNCTVEHGFVCKPDMNRRTKDGQKEYAIFLELANDRAVLDPDDYSQAVLFLEELESTRGKTIIKREYLGIAEGCANALLTHDSLDVLNTHQAMIEKRIDFELDGVLMRCKPDWFSLDLALIIDVKTTQDASPRGFSKSAAEYGYYRQAWLYREAVRIQTGVNCRFIFACVETSNPHSVACYEPSINMMSAGENDLESLLREYRWRFENDDWMQDWSKGIVPLDLPTWHKQRSLVGML